MKKNDFKILLPYLVIAIFIFMINTKVLLIAYIPSASMEPTIKSGRFVLNTRIFSNIEREDIVVFKQGNVYMIKRVIGLPGEILEIQDNKIYINGKKINCSYSKEDMETDDIKIKIPHDSYFLMGDNRNDSLDSRYYGPVSVDRIKAKKI